MRLNGHHDFRLSCPLRARTGFTLVEIMIVVAIIGVVLATSIPMMWKAMNKNELARAVNDVIEGCKSARDKAILSGVPHQFVINHEGTMNVVEMPKPAKEGEFGGGSSAKSSSHVAGSLMGAFPRKLGENVAPRLIDVNFVDHMQADEARVRFFPNGTSDEFTIVLTDLKGQRTITLDIITGLPREITK